MRSHRCGEVNESHIGQEVQLCGWAHRRRDHGGVIFIDLRDREGLVQVVFDPDTKEAFANAESVRSEFVLQVKGKVRPRPAGTENRNLPTGMIEVLGVELNILNKSETPPFPVESDIEVNEETRLRYRYIDLRRPQMQERMKLRRDVTRLLRNFLDKEASSKSKRRSSPRRRRRARVTTWCRAAPIPIRSSPCRSRRSCTSSC